MEWFQDRLSKAVVIGKSKLSGSGKRSGRALAEREEVWEYPLTALREGVANAVCHRNYVSLAATTLRLYDDRLEIWNPGKLPFQLSTTDLLQEHNSYPYNRLIAEIFYNLGIIERWGSGTVRMAEALNEQGLPPPNFDVSTNDTFKLIMHSLNSTLNQLSKRQLAALEHLKTSKPLTVAEYQILFGVSKATSTRDLTDMARKGVIVAVGEGKGSSYRLPAK